MTRPDLVIFDCDGVLVDSEKVSNHAMATNLARHGLTLTVEESMAAFVGSSMPEVEAKARELGADLPKDWIDEVYVDMFDALRQGVDPVPGILEVLSALDRAGIPCCVASNGSRAKMQITLGQTGLWSRFESVMFSAHELGTAKPAPDMFLTAAARFGITPASCVVIEDSPTGALAAKRAGMGCIGFAAFDDGAALAAQGASVIQEMSDVVGLLQIG